MYIAVMSSNSTAIEAAKNRAACQAVNDNVRSGDVLGFGTGSTAFYMASCLSERVQQKTLENILCVPASFQARHLITDHGLPLSDLTRNWTLDVCIDGADEVDPDLNCIKVILHLFCFD